MQINKYGLVFSRIQESDLEMMRLWRNNESIKNRMIFRQTITPEAQLRWFKNMNENCNYYFIASYNNEPIGLMNIKEINWSEMSGEPGGFIVDERYIGSYIPAICLLILFDFAFMNLGLLSLHGKILRSNSASLNCNLALGGIIDDDDDEVCRVSHSKEDYLQSSAKYRQAAKVLRNEFVSELFIVE